MIDIKICRVCKISKVLDLFDKRKNSIDGRDKRCIACRLIHNRKWRKMNPEYNKQYNERNKDILKIKNKIWRENNKEYRRKYSRLERVKLYNKKWQKENSERLKELRIISRQNPIVKFKYNCRAKLSYHIRKGNLKKRNSCEICHNTPTECHHDDYLKPLEYIELCNRCHQKLHIQYRDKILLNSKK